MRRGGLKAAPPSTSVPNNRQTSATQKAETMTGNPPNEIRVDSRRRSRLESDATTSGALEQTHTFAHRVLLLSLGCALLLTLTATLARAASSPTAAGVFSARLTASEIVASQAKTTKLVYKLPASKTSFTYRLKAKKGSSWRLVVSARKPGSSTSWKRITIGGLFAGRQIKVGQYRVDVFTAGAAKILRFRISPFCGHFTKKSFTLSEAKSVKLIYGFSKPSKSFAYRLLMKKGSKWQQLSKAKTTIKARKNYFVGQRTAKLKTLFGKKSFKLGTYRLMISSAYSTRPLNFKIVKSATATPAATTGGSGSGSGSGSTGGANFTISGGVSGLEPGLTLPVTLTLTNPNSTRIYVTHLAVSMSADSTPSGCSRDANFVITQSSATSTNSIAVPAKGKVTLASAPLAPQISFLNLTTLQDVCKGKSFVLTFSGSAHS
jgi:hypothetical protein